MFDRIRDESSFQSHGIFGGHFIPGRNILAGHFSQGTFYPNIPAFSPATNFCLFFFSVNEQCLTNFSIFQVFLFLWTFGSRSWRENPFRSKAVAKLWAFTRAWSAVRCFSPCCGRSYFIWRPWVLPRDSTTVWPLPFSKPLCCSSIRIHWEGFWTVSPKTLEAWTRSCRRFSLSLFRLVCMLWQPLFCQQWSIPGFWSPLCPCLWLFSASSGITWSLLRD